MLRRQEEASPGADQGQGHRRILCVDRHEDVIRGPRLRRIRGLLDVNQSIHGSAEDRDLVWRERPLTRRDDHGALRRARLVHDAFEEAPDGIEAGDGRQVVEVIEQDRGARVLSEELDDRVDEFEVEPVGPHGPLRAGRGRDPQDRRPLETEPGRHVRGRETRDAKSGRRRDDVAERAHRGAPAVLEDEVIQTALEAVAGSPRRPDLDDRLDMEGPGPRDRVRDEDRPHHRVQGSEAEARVGARSLYTMMWSIFIAYSVARDRKSTRLNSSHLVISY